MSSLFGNLMSSAESAVDGAAASLFGGPARAPGIPPGPAIVATSPAAAATVPGIVPAVPGAAPPAGMVPVYAPKTDLLSKFHALPAPYKIAIAAAAGYAAWHFVIEPRM